MVGIESRPIATEAVMSRKVECIASNLCNLGLILAASSENRHYLKAHMSRQRRTE